MRILLLTFLLMSFHLFGYSLSVTQVKIGDKILDMNDATPLNFETDYFNIDNFTDNKKAYITFSFDGPRFDKFELKHSNDQIAEVNTITPISFDLSSVFDTEPIATDDGEFQIDLVATYQNDIGETVSTTLNLFFHYDNRAPTTPEITKVVPGDKNVTLTWSDIDDAESYEITYRKVDDTEDKTQVVSSGLSYKITNLENESEYQFQVTALDKADNRSSKSDILKDTPKATDDFFEYYKKNGGEETGECSYNNSSSNSTLIFMILILLVFIKRRDNLRGKKND